MHDMTSGRLPSLDGWRACSILLVVFHHAAWTEGYPLWLAGFWERLPVSIGIWGVEIFFFISGFIITHHLLLEEHRKGKISLRSFYLRRAFRILPPAYA